MKDRFRKILPLFFAAVFSCLLSACILYPEGEEYFVTINGVVTITRNGEPWAMEGNPNFSSNPRIYAFIADPNDLSNRYYLGSASYNDVNWVEGGMYHWTMEVPEERLPTTAYFEVTIPMGDMQNGYQYPTKIAKQVLITLSTNFINLGTINIDVIELSGSLPITMTVEGEPFPESLSLALDVFGLGESADAYYATTINRDTGNWSMKVAAPDSEKQLTFRLRVSTYSDYRGIQKIFAVDPEHIVYNTDKEIVFADYPSINFDMYALSGTAKMLLPLTDEKQPNKCWIHFSCKEFGLMDITSYLTSGTFPCYKEADGSWRVEWQIMVPAFDDPLNLNCQFSVDMGSYAYDPDNLEVDIPADADLGNVYLGEISFR